MKIKELPVNDKITLILNKETNFIIGHIEKIDPQIFKVYYGFSVYTKFLGNRYSKQSAIKYIVDEAG